MIKLVSLLGIIEPIFYFLLITTLSIAKENYKLTKNYISELSGHGVPHCARTNLASFILLGSVVILFSFVLRSQVKPNLLSNISQALLIISGSSLILLGFVPTDVAEVTARGKWHRRLTFPAAVSLPLSMICDYFIFKKDKQWQNFWPKFSLVSSGLIIITDALLFIKRPKKYIGLIQRVGMGTALLWLLATSTKTYSLQ